MIAWFASCLTGVDQMHPSATRDATIAPMDEMSAIHAHAHECLATAQQVRALFEADPQTSDKVAAHAFFCRCIDHFRAAVLLAQEDLDVEAFALVRGIVETTFVVGALLTGALTCEQLEAFDRAGLAKGATAQDDFLRRYASPDLRERVRVFAERNAGSMLKLVEVAKQIDAEDLYNGHYRIFSHLAAHPSISSIEKYLEFGDDRTFIRFPGKERQQRSTILIASTIFMHTCASIEHWMGTTPDINRAIHTRLQEIDSLQATAIHS